MSGGSVLDNTLQVAADNYVAGVLFVLPIYALPLALNYFIYLYADEAFHCAVRALSKLV